jgi:hypothetical protein
MALCPRRLRAHLWRFAGFAGLYDRGMAFDELLMDRVRTCLQQAVGVSENKMFGGLAFLTGGHLTVGVYGDGIGARDMATATAQPVCGPST